MEYVYRSENVPGNLHELVHAMNQPNNYLTRGGWELVTAQHGSNYTVAIFRKPKEA